MPNLTPQNPLFQPVYYNGQTYFTSQYFHDQYHANKSEGGKYAKLSDFNRLIRNIESFPAYLDRGDIVELEYKYLKTLTDAVFAPVKALFKLNSFNPIMLINATAQVALTHHLDDELSKEISVHVNESAAAKARLPASHPREITSTFKAMLSLAKAVGLKGNQAILSADKATQKFTDHSALKLLEVDLVSDSKQALLTPTEIGKQLGLPAKDVNKMLEKLKFQKSYRDGKNNLHWDLTDIGSQYAVLLDVGKAHSNGTPVKQIKWQSGIVEVLRKA